MISSHSFSNQQLNLINYAITNNFTTIENAFRNDDDYDGYYYNQFKKVSKLNELIFDPYSKTTISKEELANKYIKQYYDALTELNPYDEKNQIILSDIKDDYMNNFLHYMSMNNSNRHIRPIRPISARTNSIDETFSTINDSIDSVATINTTPVLYTLSPTQYSSNGGLKIMNKMNTKKHKKQKKPKKSKKKSKKKSLFTNK
jgi:hypothetical protein